MKLGEPWRQRGVRWKDLITLKHNATLTGEEPMPISVRTEKGSGSRHISFCEEKYSLVIPSKGLTF